jgi:hypothetical protein
MTATTLYQLQAIDPAVLTEVVRQDLRRPDFEITSWQVEPLQHTPYIETTGGLYCFHGLGKDHSGTQVWRVVLKKVNNPMPWGQNELEIGYWKRELLIYQSGLLNTLQSPAVAPRCYDVTMHVDGGWIWLEHITESVPKQWSMEHYQLAARLLGLMGGAFLCGKPLPDYPWLNHNFFHRFLAEGEYWALIMDPQAENNAWQNQRVQALFPESIKLRILNILSRKNEYANANERLPRVLCHFDLHRRNMKLRKNLQDQMELVLVDWSVSGIGAAGNDLGELVAMSTWLFDADPSTLSILDSICLDSYLAGLREAGWSGDEQLIRLGYLISTSVWQAATLPGWAAMELSGDEAHFLEKFGHSSEVVLPVWSKLAEYWLERADEARRLMRQLNLA